MPAVNDSTSPTYLQPYLSATRWHGSAFRSLLWESRKAQATRFDALARLCNFDGQSVLDVGCGRADLLDFLLARGIQPKHYTGLEAVEPLANSARRKRRPNSLILNADFVADPDCMFTAADIVVFSGSLTTLESRPFYATLKSAHRAAQNELAFNYLASPLLAGAEFLHWHRPNIVNQFVKKLGGHIATLQDYLEGDCTLRIRKIATKNEKPKMKNAK
jgi:SAM-dependent methyltransferase